MLYAKTWVWGRYSMSRSAWAGRPIGTDWPAGLSGAPWDTLDWSLSSLPCITQESATHWQKFLHCEASWEVLYKCHPLLSSLQIYLRRTQPSTILITAFRVPFGRFELWLLTLRFLEKHLRFQEQFPLACGLSSLIFKDRPEQERGAHNAHPVYDTMPLS